MYHKILADSFFILGFGALFLAGIGYELEDIWLASTQWMLVAIILFLIAIYIKLNKDEDLEIIKSYHQEGRKTKAKK